jgi:hypothetical protein
VASLLLAGAAIAGFYVLLPELAGLQETWERIDRGEPGWLAVAIGFELLSFAAYIGLRGTVHRWQLESTAGNTDRVPATAPSLRRLASVPRATPPARPSAHPSDTWR